MSERQRPCHTARAVTLGLAAFFVAVSLGLNGLLWLVSPEPYRETVLQHTMQTLNGQSGDDSWGAMYVALEHVRAHPDVPLYQHVFFNRQYRFQYPPSSLFVLAAMLTAGVERVRLSDFHTGAWPTVNDLVGWLCLVVIAGASAQILEAGLRDRVAGDTRLLRIARAMLVLALTLTFYPAVKAYTLGQIQILITALFAVATLGWSLGWQRASGVLVGIIGLIKPHYGVLLVWAAVRRAGGFGAACAGMLAAGLGASVIVYGWANHLDYLRVLSFLSQHGEAYYPNQSVNGVLNRIAGIARPDLYVSLDLPAGKFPPFTGWIYAATLGSSLALLTLGLWPRRGQQNSAFDFGTMALCATMASPIAWEHHYAITLPLFAMMLPSVLHDRRRLMLLMASYMLVATFVPAANLLAGTWGNVLQSSLLVGAVILLWLMAGNATARPAHSGDGG